MLLLPGQAPVGKGEASGSKTCSGARGLTLACVGAATVSPLRPLAVAERAVKTGRAGLVAKPACSADGHLCPGFQSRSAAGAYALALLVASPQRDGGHCSPPGTGAVPPVGWLFVPG